MKLKLLAFFLMAAGMLSRADASSSATLTYGGAPDTRINLDIVEVYAPRVFSLEGPSSLGGISLLPPGFADDQQVEYHGVFAGPQARFAGIVYQYEPERRQPPPGGSIVVNHGGITLASGIEANVVTAVPEPEQYALLLGGLGLIACMARRRKQNA